MQPFTFTATYYGLGPIRNWDDWVKHRTEVAEIKATALAENRPMPALSREDHEFLLGMGVNGFHVHGWPADVDTVSTLLKDGTLIFSYVDDFYHMAPKTPEGGVDYFACLDELRKTLYGLQGSLVLCSALEPFCPHTGPNYPFPGTVASRQQAFDVYKAYFFEKGAPLFGVYHDYCRQRGIDFADLNVVCGSHEQWHHYNAEWGASVLFSEGNCELANDQVRTALIRGAARQFGCAWFLYWSSWGGVDRQLSIYDSEDKQASGITPSLALRQWVASFYAGADICGGIENPASQMFYHDKQGVRHPSRFNANVRKFSEFVLERHPDRGTPFVPVALMLDYHHGWDPASRRLWGGSLPYGRNEEMIDSFFDAAFPGRSVPRSNQLLTWRDEDSPYPWSTHEEVFDLEREHAFDNRVYEKGTRTDSTWGDGFDAVLTNCPLDVLKQYEAVVLLGGITLDAALREKLEAYVSGGGTLMLNVNHVSKEDATFLGVEFLGRREMLWEVKCSGCGRVFRDGEGSLELVRPTTASVLMTALGGYRFGSPEVRRIPDYDGPDPVVTCNRVGKGKVILGLLPYMQCEPRRPLHPAFCDLIDHVVKDVQPVHVEGPAIETMVNRTETGWIVTLMNNGPDYWRGKTEPETWEGRLVLGGGAGRVTELWTDEEMGFSGEDGSVTIPVYVPAFGFRVVQVENR